MEEQGSMDIYEMSNLTKSSRSSWADLMPETLELIFSGLNLIELLTVVPSVCKPWERFVKGPYCWKRINIESWSDGSTPENVDQMVRMLVKRSRGRVKEICVSKLCNDNVFSYIADNAGSLERLKLKNCNISDEVVGMTATKFSSLTSLCLCDCWEIGALGLEAIGRNCPKLSTLRRMTSYCDSEDDDLYFHISSMDDVRAILNFEDNNESDQEDGIDFKVFPKEEALVITKTMPNLKHLELGYQELGVEQLLESEDVADIIKMCKNLEYLNLSGTWPVVFNPDIYKLEYPNLKIDTLPLQANE